MSRIAFRDCAARLAPLVIGLALAGGQAAAQDTKEVTVTAPAVSRQQVGRTTSGGSIDLITVSHRVSYADLDLSKTADADAFKTRIDLAARNACSELQKIEPLAPQDPNCVRQATDRAMPQVNAAIAAASR